MKRILFVILGIVAATAAAAQQYSGRILDAESGAPIAGAIVIAATAEGTQAGFATSAADGTFTLKPREGVKAVRLDISMMGYAPQTVAATDSPLEIRLEPRAVEIREVAIRAPRLQLHGDTVTYNVASFTEAQDRSIADVLRKMPGIDVDKSGQISYNGDPINKFYIEGLDMLDGRYSLATKNIAPQDVASVEVLENHQPIKALSGISFSDRAALNLRLQKHARSHWTGTLRANGGWAPTQPLWDGSLFSMRIGAGSQSMFNLKSDNTGNDPTSELQQLSVDEIINGGSNYSAPRWFLTGTTSAPLDERRTRFNRSHLASADNLWKLSDDYQLSSHVAYGYDRTTSRYTARTVRYLADGERVESVDENSRLLEQQLSAQVKLLANTERFYLNGRLSADLTWSGFRSDLTGSYPNRQEASAPTRRVENRLNYIRRTGNRSLTFNSDIMYLAQPQWLEVMRNDTSQRQQIGINLFHTNNNISFGMQAGRRWSFTVNGGISAMFRRFDSRLTGVDPEILGRPNGENTTADQAALYGRSTFGYVAASLQPSATFNTSKIRLTLDLPAQFRRYRLEKQSCNRPVWSSRLSARWNVSAYWTLSASGSIGQSTTDDDQIFPTTLMRNYRNLTTGIRLPKQTTQQALSAGIKYRNPLNGLFFNLFAMRSWNRMPLISERRFEGDFILDSWIELPNRSSSWHVAADISKNLDAMHGQAGLDLSYHSSDIQAIQQGVTIPYRTAILTLSPHFNCRITRWMNAEYRLNYHTSRLKIEGEAGSSQHAFDQCLALNITPTEALVLQLSGEHYYTRLTSETSKHMVLADISVRWKISEKWELSASVDNLFNQSQYAYTLFDGLSSSSYSYGIRPRDILVGVGWKF